MTPVEVRMRQQRESQRTLNQLRRYSDSLLHKASDCYNTDCLHMHFGFDWIFSP